MSKVEDLYNNLAIEKTLEKIAEGSISDFTTRLYDECKIGDMSLEKFAALTANWNPGKCGLGQKAQLLFLGQDKYPNIVGLSNAGKKAIHLYEDNKGSLKIGVGKSTNIEGIKSFDAADYDTNKTTFFILKTVDIGKFSDNEGGGHQDNVLIEIKTFIKKAAGNELSFNNKSVDVVILVDGRSSKKIITRCQEILDNFNHRLPQTTKITISSCEKL